MAETTCQYHSVHEIRTNSMVEMHWQATYKSSQYIRRCRLSSRLRLFLCRRRLISLVKVAKVIVSTAFIELVKVIAKPVVVVCIVCLRIFIWQITLRIRLLRLLALPH